jgi:hypothetical protein
MQSGAAGANALLTHSSAAPHEEMSMKISTKLQAVAIVAIPCAFAACTKTQAEREEDRAEDRAEAREEARDEAREAQREQRDEPRAVPHVQSNEPERRLGTDEPSTNAASARTGLQAATVAQITAARCAREQKCGNVGAGKEYESLAACTQKIGENWREEINAYDCKGGVVTKELDECLTEIKDEDCNSPFDTLGRVLACRSSDICKSVP